MTYTSDSHSDEAIHQPGPADAPIPGTHWYGGCDPDYPTVNTVTCICRGCGEEACPECGKSNCPDHRPVAYYKEMQKWCRAWAVGHCFSHDRTDKPCRSCDLGKQLEDTRRELSVTAEIARRAIEDRTRAYTLIRANFTVERAKEAGVEL